MQSPLWATEYWKLALRINIMRKARHSAQMGVPMLHFSDLLALLFQAFLLRGCCEGARKLSASHGYALPRLSGKHREKEGAGLDVFGMEHKTL